MKRLLIMLVCVMILLPTIMASAEEIMPAEDSTFVSTEIRDILAVPEDAAVTRLYKTQIISAFSKSDTIDEVLAATNNLEIYYVEMPDGTVKELVITDGVVWETDVSTVNSSAMQFYKGDDVLDLIGEEADVQNVYYLTGEISHTGTAIYYRTSKGDYVYYNGIGAGECFFSAATFFEFMDAVFAEMLQTTGMDNGMYVNANWDMSSFRIDSPTFNLNAQLPVTEAPRQDMSIWLWVGITAVVVAAGVGGVILWKKRKTA